MISFSILLTSIVKSVGLISQKTGTKLFRTIACVVEAKVYGVVITSTSVYKSIVCARRIV